MKNSTFDLGRRLTAKINETRETGFLLNNFLSIFNVLIQYYFMSLSFSPIIRISDHSSIF